MDVVAPLKVSQRDCEQTEITMETHHDSRTQQEDLGKLKANVGTQQHTVKQWNFAISTTFSK